MYVYPNQGYKQPLSAGARTQVTYPAVDPGAPTSWAQASQLTAVQVTSGDPLEPGATAAYAIVGGRLWRYSLSIFTAGVVDSVVLVSDCGWTNKTIASAGTVNGEPGLWAREKTTGALTLYVGGQDQFGEPKHPGSPNSDQYAVATSGWPVSTKPLLTGSDFNSDGYPDVWATSTQKSDGTPVSNGTLLFAQGALSGTGAYTLGPRTNTGGTGWISGITRIT